MQRKNTLHFPILAFLFSLVVSLGVLEGVLRLIEPLEVSMRIYQFARPVIQCQFSELDPLLGWSSPPSSRTGFIADEFSTTVETNADGFRDDPFPRKRSPGKGRVLVLGDSFAFGWGVEKEERFDDVAERLSEGHIEFFNMGVSGYSTLQEELLMEALGSDLSPDIAILAFYDNDPTDNLDGFARPRAVPVESGYKLDTSGINEQNYQAFIMQDKSYLYEGINFWVRHELKELKTFFRTHSYAYNLISGRIKQFRHANLITGGPGRYDSDTWAVQKLLLDRFVNECRANGIIPFIALMPNKMEIKPSMIEHNKMAFPNPFRKLVKAYCEGNEIDHLDVTNSLSEGEREAYHFSLDDHMTPFGHQNYGERLFYQIHNILSHRGIIGDTNGKTEELLEPENGNASP